MFTTGKGGIPGNADCGGLTSCYLWNVLGIFPVSGQDRMIVGVPRSERSIMHMPAGDFDIIREGTGIYTKSASFNGKELRNFELPASEMIKGGTLRIVMSEEP
jgi:putative alpha-1,2-mannosidase